MDVMEHHHGGYEKVGFTSRDLYNYSYKSKISRILEGDAKTVLKQMSERQEEDVEFFYQYQTDAEGHLTNLFWCDAQARLDYQAFGDVVVFDSTYRVNRYKMPFIPFVGTNHHRSTVIFACGIVSDETVDSYKWLLATFLMAVYQKYPKSIITDGGIAMRKAIKVILPNTLHRLCTWHIEQNINRHLYHSAIGDFRKLLYGKIKQEDFEDRWKEFIARQKIREDNKWANMMYKTRRLWAAAYIDDKLFLGMKSNQRSESLNSNLLKHLDRNMLLLDLVEHYEHCLSRMRRNEAEYDCKANQSIPVCKTNFHEIEFHAAHIFTPKVFYLIQDEIQEAENFVIVEVLDNDDSKTYLVASHKLPDNVISVNCVGDNLIENVTCSCLKLECEGLPCKHIFVVLKGLNATTIPKCCIWKRWTKNAKTTFPSDRRGNMHNWSDQMARFREMTTMGDKIFHKASKTMEDYQDVMKFLNNKLYENEKQSGIVKAVSQFEGKANVDFEAKEDPYNQVLDPLIVATKGAPKKRLKSFSEVRKYKCGHCHQFGHSIRTCPLATTQ